MFVFMAIQHCQGRSNYCRSKTQEKDLAYLRVASNIRSVIKTSVFDFHILYILHINHLQLLK